MVDVDPETDVSNRRGFALEATLILLILLTVLISAGLAATMMVQRSAGVDYRGARATYAAESGADHVMSQLEADIQDGVDLAMPSWRRSRLPRSAAST